MASGDTKTEALLNILGSGGDYSEIDGSGNTKTQDYIIAAIKKIKELEEKIDEDSGVTTFYVSFFFNQPPVDNVSLYLDKELTQFATGGDLWDAMEKGQVCLCQPAAAADTSYNHKITSLGLSQPAEKTADSFGSQPPEVLFSLVSGYAALQFVSSQPEDGENSFAFFAI